jgi:hypothetical protein
MGAANTRPLTAIARARVDVHGPVAHLTVAISTAITTAVIATHQNQ